MPHFTHLNDGISAVLCMTVLYSWSKAIC